MTRGRHGFDLTRVDRDAGTWFAHCRCGKWSATLDAPDHAAALTKCLAAHLPPPAPPAPVTEQDRVRAAALAVARGEVVVP